VLTLRYFKKAARVLRAYGEPRPGFNHDTANHQGPHGTSRRSRATRLSSEGAEAFTSVSAHHDKATGRITYVQHKEGPSE
jgi:hypothetical protein